jgi:two-component system response regulator AtoC
MAVKSPTRLDPRMSFHSPANGNHQYVPAASAAMRAVERVVADIAPTDIPILLVGEIGTGKEIVAAHIHRLSQRSQQPFVKMSCAALTPEFFQAGRSHGANGGSAGLELPGTVLLDEISELDAACQPRLLHALPDSEGLSGNGGGITIVGRIISTTSRNLEEQMRAGRFREELYYRINGVCLRLPPLRQRREDVLVLAEHFLEKYAATFGRPKPVLSARARAEMNDYAWPGNVRELENFIRKLVATGDEPAALDELRQDSDARNGGGYRDAAADSRGASLSLKDAARAASRQAERELILKVLGRTRWNRKRAAQELQISYKALLYKLKQIGLDDQAAS